MTTRELPPVPFDEYNAWKDKDRLATLIMRRAWLLFNTREEALAQAAEDGGGGVIFDMVSSPRYNYAGGASIGWTYVPQDVWEQMPPHMVASMPHANPRSGSSGKHKYNVTVLVDASSKSEAKRMVEGAKGQNPNEGSTFEITSFLIRKAGARLIQMGLIGDWNNPSIYQLPDGRKVYLVGNDWQFEGSSGTGYQSLKKRFDSEVAAREADKYHAMDAQRAKEEARKESAKEAFMQNAGAFQAGRIRAGADDLPPDIYENSAELRVRFASDTWAEFDKATLGTSIVVTGKRVSGWKGARERAMKYGDYE
jgi:hypothetical protein